MQEQYTRKSQEALASAQDLARAAGNPELSPLHLASALLAEPEGAMASILLKLDVDPKILRAELDREIAKLPRQSGGQLAASRALQDVLSDAGQLARKMGDQFVSTEHLFHALSRKSGPELSGLLAARGLRPERVEAALTEIRGDRKVTTPEPEATFEALKKYARDLTAEARAGKLDPVIGRDQEIRRVASRAVSKFAGPDEIGAIKSALRIPQSRSHALDVLATFAETKGPISRSLSAGRERAFVFGRVMCYTL